MYKLETKIRYHNAHYHRLLIVIAEETVVRIALDIHHLLERNGFALPMHIEWLFKRNRATGRMEWNGWPPNL